jgi:site-specific recombinase XerD
MHPRHLMELLGHNSMETLNPYLSVSIADLKERITVATQEKNKKRPFE